jgi:hypothetical protein
MADLRFRTACARASSRQIVLTDNRAMMDGRHHVAAVICDATDATIDVNAA